MIKELTGTMQVICLDCGTLIEIVPCDPRQDGKVSGGYCEKCAAIRRDVLEKWLKDHPKKSGDACYNAWQEEGGRSAGLTWADDHSQWLRQREVINQEWW